MNSPARGRRRSGLLHFGNACTSPQVCCKILRWHRRSCKGEWTEITPKRGLTGKPWLKDGVINLIRFLWKQHADGAVVLFPAGWQSRQKDSVMGSAFYRWRQCRFHSAALVYSPVSLILSPTGVCLEMQVMADTIFHGGCVKCGGSYSKSETGTVDWEPRWVRCLRSRRWMKLMMRRLLQHCLRGQSSSPSHASKNGGNRETLGGKKASNLAFSPDSLKANPQCRFHCLGPPVKKKKKHQHPLKL